jgi:hypothetical protein
MVKGRGRLANSDRWFFVQLYRWFPSVLNELSVVQPETLVRWHRLGAPRAWRSIRHRHPRPGSGFALLSGGDT